MKIPKLLIVALLLSSCAKNERVETKRTPVDLMPKGQVEALPPFRSALEDSSVGACARLNDLKKKKSKGPTYSYLAAAKVGEEGWEGALDIAESPFTQFILGEKFAAGDEEEFYEKAKKEYEEGKLSSVKWLTVKVLHNLGLVSWVQYSAINDKLEENFPGIFGTTAGMDNSLPFKLASRVTTLKNMSASRASSILTTKIPLFPSDSGWSGLAAETKISLAAAMQGISPKSNSSERLCAHVLLSQHFAQLLRLKGHRSPKITKPSSNPRRPLPFSQIAKLSSSQPEFRTQEVTGAFYDLAEEQSILLENETIQKYDPASHTLGITKDIPNGSVSDKQGNLSDALSLMEALTYGLEITSPASPLSFSQDYLYGDISAEGSKAILPAEAHALSLGLLTMHFKNLALLHLQKINAEGKALAEGESAAGIMLASGEWNGASTNVKLDDVVRFTRLVSYLDHTLSALLARTPAELASLNAVYQPKTLASLLGKAMFSEEELNKLLTPQEQKNVLLDNVKALKFPLAVLLSRYSTDAGCFANIEWNSELGSIKLQQACEANEKKDLADVFELLARDTKSALLLKKAEQIRAK